MAKFLINRRKFLTAAGVTTSGAALAGCDALNFVGNGDGAVRNFLENANWLTYRAQRLLYGDDALAQEFTEADIRQPMRPNGSTSPDNEAYNALKANDFADYRLKVSGMVNKELSLSLADLRSMPSRTQITRHDCVEGWSCIAKWKGVQLSRVLEQAGVNPSAKYVLFRCLDDYGNSLAGPVSYYETIDLVAARNPQTILAYDMNDKTLPVSNGAPLRVRIEQQLGYKMAKYIREIVLIDDFSKEGDGHGGYWEDNGYDWFAGI